MIGYLLIISKCAIRSFRERCSSVPHLRRSCHWPHHPLLLHPSWQVCNDFFWRNLMWICIWPYINCLAFIKTFLNIGPYIETLWDWLLFAETSILQVVPRQWLGLENPSSSHRSTCLLASLPPPHSLPLGQAQGWRCWRLFPNESKRQNMVVGHFKSKYPICFLL